MNATALKSAAIERAEMDPGIRVRIAESADRDFVMSLVPRLVASGLPSWRDPRKMLAAYGEVIGSMLYAPRSDAALLVAEDEHATPLGFILVVAATDCYTHERHGHVAQLALADPQDLVDGQVLIRAAEAWARSRGYRLLTVSEFWASHPARAICRQLGFVEEAVSYRKTVR